MTLNQIPTYTLAQVDLYLLFYHFNILLFLTYYTDFTSLITFKFTPNT